ncbi:hypothetical protein ACN4EG_19810 [Alkalinema pantanalense CENA528]|uniref:hypothetical protein n=1 Tax=Alkalinema pantanalense TaxID=1620705 RepID=UPI003D6F37E7
MKPEVVKDFLNVPGILGIALLDKQSPLYFCGIETPFHLQQTTVLEHGLRQILSTMPEAVREFELQFQTYRIHIYRFINTATILILTQPELKLKDYQVMVAPLLDWVQTSHEGTIAEFREIAEQVLPSAPSIAAAGTPEVPSQTTSPSPTSAAQPQSVAAAASAPAPAPPIAPDVICLQDQLSAFNDLSQIATQYLGNAIIANHLSRSRPDVPWLQQFSIDRSAHLSFTGDPKQVTQPMSEAEINDMQQWAKAFISQCSRIIRDFPLLAKQQSPSISAQFRWLI